MFNQHAKWLKTTHSDPVAPADRVAELPALLARLAPGPQRLLPPGPGLHRPRRQQEGRGRPRLPAAGRQLPALGGRPLPAQPPLRQRHRGRQAARAAVPRRWTTRSAHCTRGLGIWEWASNDDGERAGRRDGLRRRRPDPGDARRRRRSCASTCPTCASGSSTSSTSCACRPSASTRTGCPTREFDALFTRRPAGDLRLPRLPVADPPPDLPAHEPRTTSTSAATTRRAPPRRRSTWSCSTSSTASTWSWTSSTACPASAQRAADAAPADGRRAAAPSRLHARGTATTCPRSRDWTVSPRRPRRRGTHSADSAPGVRVLVVNAGSSSLKLRLLGPTRRAARRARPRAPRRHRRRARRRRRRTRRRRRGRPPHRARRRALPRPGARRRRRRSPRCATGRPGAAAPAEVAGRARRGQRARCRACPPVACFDTAFHATMPPAARTYALPREWRERWGAAALRLPRPLARLRRAARRRADRRPAACAWSAATWAPAPRCRGARRPLGRHDHGLHAARGPGHGHPLGQRRPGPAAVAARARRASPSGTWQRRSSTTRACTALAGTRRHARGARARRAAGDQAPSWRSTSTCTACAAPSPRWRRRSAASTRWSSPAASASARRRVRAAACHGLEFLGVGLDVDANRRAAGDAEIDRRGSRRTHARHRGTRGSGDRARRCAAFSLREGRALRQGSGTCAGGVRPSSSCTRRVLVEQPLKLDGITGADHLGDLDARRRARARP